jgi:hypothetical protein
MQFRSVLWKKISHESTKFIWSIFRVFVISCCRDLLFFFCSGLSGLGLFIRKSGLMRFYILEQSESLPALRAVISAQAGVRQVHHHEQCRRGIQNCRHRIHWMPACAGRTKKNRSFTNLDIEIWDLTIIIAEKKVPLIQSESGNPDMGVHRLCVGALS